MVNKQENLTRLLSYEILLDLYKGNNFYDKIFKFYIKKYKLNQSQKKYINNLVLTSLREHIKCTKIIDSFSKKKINIKSNLLLIIAVTQILFFNTPDYAVVNTTVNIAKNTSGIDSSFINAILRKIIKNLNNIQTIKVTFSDLPKWFKNETKDWDINTKKKFLNHLNKKPSLHIVLKNRKYLSNLRHLGVATSVRSMFVNQYDSVRKIPDYDRGSWWVQDFSAMLPLYLFDSSNFSNIIDMCAAPGGKTLQLLSENSNIDIYEKKEKKILELKNNLMRCGYNNKINLLDVLKVNKKNYYDFAVLDAPCSAIGTVRRNPEILFRKKYPNINNLSNYQLNLLDKAADLVCMHGVIIYIVCSFFRKETTYIINKFLRKHKNFSLERFPRTPFSSSFLNKNNQIRVIPTIYKEEYYIDGFFAAILKKINE